MSNVVEFGADPKGDYDSTDAISHAISQGDGLIEFPRGIYKVTKPIHIELPQTGPIAIHGQGGTAKILSSSDGPTFYFTGTHETTADPAGFKPSEWRKERFATIADLEIEGTTPNTDGILFEQVAQPTVEKVLIRECRHGIVFRNRARNVVIANSHIYHNVGVGIYFDNVNLHQSIIGNSHISYCRLGGIRIENSEIRNLQITGNDIEYNNARSHGGTDEPTAEIYIDAGESGSIREGTICSNTIQSTYSAQGANIRMIGSSADSRPDHKVGMWTISGNLVGSQKNNIHLTRVRGVTMTGNYIYSGHHRNVLIEESRNIVLGSNCIGHNPDYRDRELATGIRIEKCQAVSIHGLLIEDARAGKHTLPNTMPIQRNALVEIIDCDVANLTGCQILDGAPCGLQITDSSRVIVSDCSILDRRPQPLMKTPILWTGHQSGNVLANCLVTKTETGCNIDSSVKINGITEA